MFSMNQQSKTAEYAPVLLRFGLSFLFLWFGISQITSPDSWTVWVPEWGNTIFGLGAVKLVLFNGWFEIAGGILLALGLWTRWVALLLSLHLFFIAYEVGYNDIGVRDFVLAVSTLAVSLFGPDKFSLDNKLRRE
ncbi:MAG: DoxX family protein [Candidatus Kaiserbacteria bacterium]|nr:DoxX family protein [Candidatus Kaiserbacteria bacterium]